MSGLTPDFVRHASIAAIEAALDAASARERSAAQEVNALMGLYRMRVQQVTLGEWPTSGQTTDTAAETGTATDGGER